MRPESGQFCQCCIELAPCWQRPHLRRPFQPALKAASDWKCNYGKNVAHCHPCFEGRGCLGVAGIPRCRRAAIVVAIEIYAGQTHALQDFQPFPHSRIGAVSVPFKEVSPAALSTHCYEPMSGWYVPLRGQHYFQTTRYYCIRNFDFSSSLRHGWRSIVGNTEYVCTVPLCNADIWVGGVIKNFENIKQVTV